jgi:hypothetical protein
MIAQAVEKINDSLRVAFGDNPVAIYGIADSILINDEKDNKENEVYFPAIIDESGECVDVFVNDEYRIGIYHKIIGKNYNADPKKAMGDNPRTVVVVDMAMICWGFLNTITAEQLEQFIYAKAPNDMRFTNTDFDRKRVLSGEVIGVDFSFPPEAFLFSIKYKVQYIAKKACMEISNFFNS